jgi:hypothetical protein
MGQKKAWNHDALFDYTDRYMKLYADDKKEGPSSFPREMWKAYRGKYEQAGAGKK